MSTIEAKEFYVKKLNEKVETDIKLSLANLELLKKKEAKLQSEMDDIQTAKAEWQTAKREAEEKLCDPDPVIKRWLETDFHREGLCEKGAAIQNSRFVSVNRSLD